MTYHDMLMIKDKYKDKKSYPTVRIKLSGSFKWVNNLSKAIGSHITDYTIGDDGSVVLCGITVIETNYEKFATIQAKKDQYSKTRINPRYLELVKPDIGDLL